MRGRREREMRRARRGGGGAARALGGAAALTALILAPAASDAGGLAAQTADELLPPPRVVAVAGWFQRDGFFGEGPSGLYGVRVRLPLGSWLVAEPALQYTSFTPDPGDPDAPVGDDVQLLTLDFQFQLQLPLDVLGRDRLRPWLGAGLGGAADFRDDRGEAPFLMGTLTASAGMSFDVGAGFSVLGEGRLRVIDDLDRRGLEAVLGVGWSP